jgi:hypothetical protein
MASCPRPELIGTIVYVDFVSDKTDEYLGHYFGKVTKWRSRRGGYFRAVFEDGYAIKMFSQNVEDYTLRVADCVDLIRNSDNKAQTFSKILRRITDGREHVVAMIPSFYDKLYLDCPDFDKIKPRLWGLLGEDANEKFRNAARILEMIYYHNCKDPYYCPMHGIGSS